MSLLDNLIEMGFPKEKAEKALKSTGGTNLEEAINWIINHQDDDTSVSVDTELVEPNEESTVEITMGDKPKSPDAKPKSPSPQLQEPKSMKCEDCGKLFKNESEVEFHAVKSGHVNFSESTEEVKPLSEEEKRSRMLALQERLKQKRLEKDEEEKKAVVDSEKQRRITGQQMAASKQRIEEMEMKKIAEDRKRQKKEDALAKQRILDQIKMDREAKKQQQAGGGQSTELPPQVASHHNQQPAAAAPEPAKKNYDQCQLQVRLMNGQTLKHTFGAKESLSAVRLYVQMQSGDIAAEPFTFMTNFPKRVFNDEDMESPLTELGLVPSAVLIMTRKAQ